MTRLMASFALTGVMWLSACSPEPAARHLAQTTSTLPSQADVIRYLEAEAVRQMTAYPGARLTNIRFNPDQTKACGLLEYPGQEPLVFVSTDSTPQTVERSLALGYLHREGEWSHRRQREMSERNRRQCERENIRPGG